MCLHLSIMNWKVDTTGSPCLSLILVCLLLTVRSVSLNNWSVPALWHSNSLHHERRKKVAKGLMSQCLGKIISASSHLTVFYFLLLCSYPFSLSFLLCVPKSSCSFTLHLAKVSTWKDSDKFLQEKTWHNISLPPYCPSQENFAFTI